MARFDVYAFGGMAPLVIDIQASLHSGIGSCVVMPLVPADGFQSETMTKLNPILRVGDAGYRLITTDIVAIPRAMLGERIANLEDQREVVIDAVDFLLQGF
jgi:toxin CcdB